MISEGIGVLTAGTFEFDKRFDCAELLERFDTVSRSMEVNNFKFRNQTLP
jgi:hypothetical protein